MISSDTGGTSADDAGKVCAGGACWPERSRACFDNHITSSGESAEAGINRVFVRASRTAGTLTLRATSSGLTAATATSAAFTTSGGLTTLMPAGY